jgi:hypothetical protein
MYETILILSPVHFVGLNPSYGPDVIKVLGLDSDEHFPIVRCPECDFYYALYRLTPELLDKLYNQCIDLRVSQAKIYKAGKRKDYLRVWLKLFDLWSTGKGDETINLQLLDYGCGWGDFMSTAQMPGVTCIGLEFDQRKVSYVRKLGFQVMDSPDELKEFSPVDLFFCNQVLEHVPEPKTVIYRINRCLAMGAYGFVGVPHFGEHSMREVVNCFKKGTLVDKNVNPWEHLNYFSPASLGNLLEEGGFRLVNPQQDNGSLCFSKKELRDLWEVQRTVISEGVKHFFKKEQPASPSNDPSGTALYVQKIREM